MGQPVKLSDALVLDARLSADLTERSIAGQIEFWAALGRAIEPLLHFNEVLDLKRRAASKPLSECLRNAGTKAGHRQLQSVLKSRPFPHYEAAADRPGHLVRIDEDGTRTIGRFVNREFVPA
ncbi:TA system antitoxin ParD family protein [Verrucomicrobiota bacterium sgz303538]